MKRERERLREREREREKERERERETERDRDRGDSVTDNDTKRWVCVSERLLFPCRILTVATRTLAV